MKILQVVPYFPPAYAFGGPGIVAYEISKELAKRGHEVTVYTTDAKDLTSRLNIDSPRFLDGVQVYYFRNFSIKLVKWSKLFILPEMLSKTIGKIKEFDIVHLHEYRTFQDIVTHHLTKKYNVPYVFQVHGSLPIMMAKKRLKLAYDILFGCKLLRDASKVIALTPMESQDYRNMGVTKEKIAIIPDGIDPQPFLNLPECSIFRRIFNIPSEYKIVLFMGRIHKIKGLHYLIHAFAQVVKDFNKAMLVICGPDDGYLSDAKKLVEYHKISDNVRFVGLVSGVTKLCAYVDASVVVCPSLYGAFDLVPIEAAFCGKPLIASNLSTYGLAKLIEEGHFGLLVNPLNVNELKNAIILLLRNQDLATRLGSNSRAYAFNNLTTERMVDKLEKLYADVC